MIKSDKEKTKKIVYIIAIIKAPYQMTSIFANVFPGLAIMSERNTPLEGFEPRSKVKLQDRCGLRRNHSATDLSCPEARHLFNILLSYETGSVQTN